MSKGAHVRKEGWLGDVFIVPGRDSTTMGPLELITNHGSGGTERFRFWFHVS